LQSKTLKSLSPFSIARDTEESFASSTQTDHKLFLKCYCNLITIVCVSK